MSAVATTTAAVQGRVLTVSVREARMCVERILLTLGIPAGYVHGVRDAVLHSESLGLGGFRHMLDQHTRLKIARFASLRAEETEDSVLEVDAAGLHAWLAVPAVADLAVEVARRCGGCMLRVRNVDAPAELKVLEPLAPRYAMRAVPIATDSGDAMRYRFTHAAQPQSLADSDPLLDCAIRQGWLVQESLWRAVYELSNQALAPDSVQSRRHAGPVVMLDDGSIVGRLPADDDFDPSMLRKVDVKPK